jgi:dihydrolipoamide dehydrogenase
MVMGELMQETDVLVIGAGPGGYAAAFRAADLGLDVTMVNSDPRPGGECLFRGCIPSKTFLHLADLIHDTRRSHAMGIRFSEPRIDIDILRSWKEKVIDKLAGGLENLCNRRGVQLLHGRAAFEGSDKVRLYDSEVSHIKFRHAIIATGSHPTPFPDIAFESGSRIMDSAGALDLADIPESLLILGGGYIALEMATVYAALGSQVTIAVRSERLLRGADADLAEPLIRRMKEICHEVLFHTRAAALKEGKDHVEVAWQGESRTGKASFDRVLVAMGRQPNSQGIGLEKTGVKLSENGFIQVDNRQCTNDERVFAIGDVAGGLLLAHKAMYEGKVAAEVIAGQPSAFDVRAIPAVVYTDPQVAWCGLTEEEARRDDRNIRVERFSWKFSGRALTMDAPEGLTKLIVDSETDRILGVGITGRAAEGMIAEGVLAVEMGALAGDMAGSIHPHPTLSETLGETADLFLGSAIHVIPKKRDTANTA